MDNSGCAMLDTQSTAGEGSNLQITEARGEGGHTRQTPQSTSGELVPPGAAGQSHPQSNGVLPHFSVRLRFNSVDEARPHSVGRDTVKALNDDWRTAKANQRPYVERIVRTMMATNPRYYQHHPTQKDNGDDLTGWDISEWYRWQRSSVQTVVDHLAIPGVQTRVEAKAWLMVDAFLDTHENGIVLGSSKPDTKSKFSVRFEDAIRMLRRYAAVKEDLLEDMVFHEFAANPPGYVVAKIRNLWVNSGKSKKKFLKKMATLHTYVLELEDLRKGVAQPPIVSSAISGASKRYFTAAQIRKMKKELALQIKQTAAQEESTEASQKKPKNAPQKSKKPTAAKTKMAAATTNTTATKRRKKQPDDGKSSKRRKVTKDVAADGLDAKFAGADGYYPIPGSYNATEQRDQALNVANRLNTPSMYQPRYAMPSTGPVPSNTPAYPVSRPPASIMSRMDHIAPQAGSPAFIDPALLGKGPTEYENCSGMGLQFPGQPSDFVDPLGTLNTAGSHAYDQSTQYNPYQGPDLNVEYRFNENNQWQLPPQSAPGNGATTASPNNDFETFYDTLLGPGPDVGDDGLSYSNFN